MHRDVRVELEPGRAEQAAMDLWRGEFNGIRPHEALGMKCPAEVYAASDKKYKGTPEDLDYPGMTSRKVSTRGVIGWARNPSVYQHQPGWLVSGPKALNRGNV